MCIRDSYSIVDGFFVGNSIGDMGLSAINVAYPIVAVIQAAGTGIGMGGAVYYSCLLYTSLRIFTLPCRSDFPRI